MTNLSKSERKDMMANGWPMVPLGSLLTRVKEEVDLQDNVIYKQTTVRLWNKGVVLRGEQSGRGIKTKRQFRIHSGQLVLSRIDVRNGAIGLVPPELDNAIISNDFWTYEVDQSQLAPKFLALCVTTPSFQDEANRASSGTTHRIRAEEEGFLQISVPLPPLTEQRRIVARIEELAAKIEEARGLRQEAVQQCDNLLRSIIFNDRADYRLTAMHELVKLREPDVQVQPDEVYQFAGVYCFGEGVFKGPCKSGLEFAYNRLTRLHTGNFVYPKLMAWEGALGIIPDDCDGFVVSTEFPVFEVDQSCVLPEILDVYFRSPQVWPLLSATSTGTNVRRRRLNPRDFLEFQMPLLPMSEQLQFREVKKQMDAVKRLQAETSAELEALLPSVLDRAFKGEL